MLSNRSTYLASKIVNLAAPNAPTDAGADRSIRIGSDGLLYWKTPGGNWVRQNGSIWTPSTPPPPSILPIFNLHPSNFSDGTGKWTDSINSWEYLRSSGGIFKSGSYISFNGASNLLSTVAGNVPVIGTGKSFSFSIWVKPNIISERRVFDMGNVFAVGDPGFGFSLANGGVGAGLHFLHVSDPWPPNSQIQKNSVPITINTWFHILFVADRTNGIGKLYINGANITPDINTVEIATGAIGTPSTTLMIGATGPGGGDAFSGLMGEIKVWDIALSPSESLQEYNNHSAEYV